MRHGSLESGIGMFDYAAGNTIVWGIAFEIFKVLHNSNNLKNNNPKNEKIFCRIN